MKIWIDKKGIEEAEKARKHHQSAYGKILIGLPAYIENWVEAEIIEPWRGEVWVNSSGDTCMMHHSLEDGATEFRHGALQTCRKIKVVEVKK